MSSSCCSATISLIGVSILIDGVKLDVEASDINKNVEGVANAGKSGLIENINAAVTQAAEHADGRRMTECWIMVHRRTVIN